MRWSTTLFLIPDALAIRDALDALPGKPPQQVLDRDGNPSPIQTELSELALAGSPSTPGSCYIGVSSAWAIGIVNTVAPGAVFGPEGAPPPESDDWGP